MVHVFRSLYQDFGPIVELSALGKKSVVIFDPDMYLQVHRACGSCPFGATDTLWMLHAYFENRKKLDSGFMKMDYGSGEEWIRVRKPMQKGLFVPESSTYYSEHLNEVCQDASRLIVMEMQKGKSLHEFLQRLSFEMVSYSLLGKRMGALTNDEPLLRATIRSIECASAMMMSPIQEYNMTLNTRLWKDWVKSVDYMLERTAEIIENAIQSKSKKSYIDILRENNELTMSQIVSNIPGLMMAGFETVASTLSWTLIHLAQNEHCQAILYEEIQRVLGDRPFQKDDISHMPYLKSTIREVHRLTPTAFAILRRMDEPVVIDNYEIPAKAWLCFSPVGISMDPKFVESPEEFNPGRYLNRVAREWPLFDHPLMRDGFGYGPRKCLGFRLAEMEIWTVIVTLIRDYQISLAPGTKKFDIVNHAATYPSPTPQLIFKKRT
ncbi:predicted protein [Naegleria gruberi]|uniref:Predicted protein n=1 Tax=Naegleria gruberi TaxID=5762 RepID=D2VFT9_NAEGR|nr:uncharacterized protein NAEGRDRAFT_79810 [Naegleria gruberi]EFC44139.1 predicted protein [Naegleria gruberi]|eukprot:XP_002676883.1 predicted protein [Naegleria gruberi strain NEG-M]